MRLVVCTMSCWISIPEAQSKEQLVIVRDGQLHLVPFDALLDRHSDYIVESRTVVYSPSASSFFLLRTAAQPKNSAQTVLAVGGVPYDRSNLTPLAVTRGYSATVAVKSPRLTRRSACRRGRVPEPVEDVAAWRQRD